jgi:hypothetical protein
MLYVPLSPAKMRGGGCGSSCSTHLQAMGSAMTTLVRFFEDCVRCSLGSSVVGRGAFEGEFEFELKFEAGAEPPLWRPPSGWCGELKGEM